MKAEPSTRPSSSGGRSQKGTSEPPDRGGGSANLESDFFRDLCDNAEDLIQSVAPDGRFLYANHAWHRVLGYTDEDLRQVRLFDIIHPSCRDHCASSLRTLLSDGQPVHMEAIFKAKDGRKVEVEGTASCRFEGGKPVSTRGIFRDVTERNRARDQLDRLWDLSLDLLCVAGVDGYFKQVNPAFERVLGYSRDELLSRRFVEFVHPDDRQATEQEVVHLAEGHPVVNFQNRYLAADGSWKWLAWKSAPLADRGLIYAVARDVTESKRIEELMAAQAEELERSNRDLEQFAYVASHDLRAPLRTMANLADWIEEDLPGDIPAKVRDHLEKLRVRLTRLEQLTSDLLDYSRAGTGREPVRKVDTALLVSDIATELDPPEGFKVIPRFGLPSLETARSQLERVLSNLIDNAIKHHHAEKGEVVVSATERGDWYEFRVEDDGPGIPVEERLRIFNMFHRLEPERGVEGSGLGLAMVKRTVERLGGAVRVEPGKDGGSAFYFTWPKVMPPPRESHAQDPGRR